MNTVLVNNNHKGPSSKRKAYFNEFNVLMEKAAYLPVVSGLLRAYAETVEDLEVTYEFMPFFFCRDSFKSIMTGTKIRRWRLFPFQCGMSN